MWSLFTFCFIPVVVVLEEFCQVRGEDEFEKKNVFVKLILENVVFLIKKVWKIVYDEYS